LLSLNQQDYPRQLIEIVVVDDGSPRFDEQAIRDAAPGLDVQVAQQARQGFGLSRARNLGARIAQGEIVVFLDCDMLATPGFLTAHVSPHQRIDHAVVVGSRHHVDLDGPGGPTAEALLHTLASAPQSFGRDLGLEHAGEPPWRATLLTAWRDLRDPRSVPYRIASGGNLSIRREFYWEVGGTSERFVQWGGEDIEFAYRAAQAGAFFVIGRDALAWHQGLMHGISPSERQSQRSQQDLLADLIPLAPFRRPWSPRRHTVPRLLLDADGNTDGMAIIAFLDELFTLIPDTIVRFDSLSSEARLALDRAYDADGRVLGPGEETPEGARCAPLRAQCRGADGAHAATTLQAACEELLDGSAAAGASGEGTVKVWLASAEARLRWSLDLADEDVPQAVGEAFGFSPSRGGPRTPVSAGGAAPEDIEAAVESLRRFFWRLPQPLRRVLVRCVNAAYRLSARR
jgi:GT2 family glycosyltransferase